MPAHHKNRGLNEQGGAQTRYTWIAQLQASRIARKKLRSMRHGRASLEVKYHNRLSADLDAAIGKLSTRGTKLTLSISLSAPGILLVEINYS
jgi:hypothetical protein